MSKAVIVLSAPIALRRINVLKALIVPSAPNAPGSLRVASAPNNTQNQSN